MSCNCNCNNNCMGSTMEQEYVHPPGTGLDTSLPLYGSGFGNPLSGDPRGEPKETIPNISPAGVTTHSGSSYSAATHLRAGKGIGAQGMGLEGVKEGLRKHWPWLVVGALVVAAVVVK